MNSMPIEALFAESILRIPTILAEKAGCQIVEIKSKVIDARLIAAIIHMSTFDEGKETAARGIAETEPLRL